MRRFTVFGLCFLLSGMVSAQEATVRGSVNIVRQAKSQSGNADVVISLTPAGGMETVQPGESARLVQKDKRFSPHLVAVTVGTAIEFPNRDPFFHDVFSIYHGKPFDLGLYESGAVRSVRFTRPGVSYIFCNIHPDMSAVVLAMTTPYFATSSRDGSFQIAHVPPGKYKLAVWYEFAAQPELAALSRDVEVSDGNNALPAITIHASSNAPEHFNKYGEAYTPDKKSNY
jgi:plastocyanin